jgi:hypothetical protein
MSFIAVHLLKRRVVLDYLQIFGRDQLHRVGERIIADFPHPARGLSSIALESRSHLYLSCCFVALL